MDNFVTIPFDVSKYTHSLEIGRGGYAVVYKTIRCIDDKTVAIKRIRKTRLTESRISDTLLIRGIPSEYIILKNLCHHNIPKVYSLEENSEYFYIIMEYIPGKSINTYRQPKDAIHILRQLVEVLIYLHKVGVVHRDIKLENIVVDSQLKVTLVDFGFAIAIDLTQPDIFQKVGTVMYRAPEMFEDEPFDPRMVDIWSLGIVFYSLLMNEYPFSGADSDLMEEILEKPIFQDIPKWTLDECPPSCIDLMCKMLDRDPDERISIYGILRSKAFQEFS